MRVGMKLKDAVVKYRAMLDKAMEAGENLPVLDAAVPLETMRVLQRKASDVIKRELEALPELIEDAQEAIDELVDALDLLDELADGEIAMEKLEGQKVPSVFDPAPAMPVGDGLLSPDRGLATSGGGEG
jgi:hypothetical protein